MSFQAYLDTIRSKTGLEPADFARIAAEKDIELTANSVIQWLAADYGLGRGHAMAIFASLKPTHDRSDAAGQIDKLFSGAKAHWRPTFDAFVTELEKLGEVGLAPTASYVSLLKGTAKFAIVAATADRLDVGIKLKSAEPTSRFEASGSWNSMVTHRVRITDPAQVDTELLEWAAAAYAAA